METDEEKMTDTVIWRQLKTIKCEDRQAVQTDKETAKRQSKYTQIGYQCEHLNTNLHIFERSH